MSAAKSLLSPWHLDALTALLEDNRNNGLWKVEKVLKSFVVEHGLEAVFPIDQKQVFNMRVRAVLRCVSTRWYQAMRAQHLEDGRYPLWLYKSHACEPHGDLDGVALVVDHPFWNSHFPANGWICACAVYGAHGAASISRLGGDPNKPLPTHWNQTDPQTGLPYGIEKHFLGRVHPSLATCIETLVSGEYPHI